MSGIGIDPVEWAVLGAVVAAAGVALLSAVVVALRRLRPTTSRRVPAETEGLPPDGQLQG